LVNKEAAAEAVAADKAALSLPKEVTEDFVLPSTGKNASNITWKVEKTDHAILGEDGYSVDVVRAEKENVTVTFTAEIAMAGITDTKTFDVVIVKEALTNEDIVLSAIEALDIPNADAVKGHLSLPTEMEVEGTEKTASITWKSSDPDIISDKEVDGKAAGSREALIYIMHEERPLGCPTRRYYHVCLEGYQRFGFDAAVLEKALIDSVGEQEAEYLYKLHV
ncbi:MAG: hypothetical protein IJO65_11135, partial [Lachnospiraceae bacterium]|nr:hypothetical protein [Lachnospiraceae bacterium]